MRVYMKEEGKTTYSTAEKMDKRVRRKEEWGKQNRKEGDDGKGELINYWVAG